MHENPCDRRCGGPWQRCLCSVILLTSRQRWLVCVDQLRPFCSANYYRVYFLKHHKSELYHSSEKTTSIVGFFGWTRKIDGLNTDAPITFIYRTSLSIVNITKYHIHIQYRHKSDRNQVYFGSNYLPTSKPTVSRAQTQLGSSNPPCHFLVPPRW